MSWFGKVALVSCIAWCSACASIQGGRYGLSSLGVTGNSAVTESAITECLISKERESFGITVGLAEPVCGVPPFDSSPVRLNLWRWPWTEWPTFNRAVFDQDLERVLRFYRARGYYDAKIVQVIYAPEHAGQAGAVGRCEANASDCRVDILIAVDEGEPIRIATIDVKGIEALPEPVQRSARQVIELELGQPADEASYDRSKSHVRNALRGLGWAGAQVQGEVAVDTQGHRAQVTYRVAPGPLYEFGKLSVTGHGELPEDVIEQAASLPTGSRFDPEVLKEIQAEVFALGAFSTVEVAEHLDVQRRRADVTVSVTPLPVDALRAGVGVLSGATRRTETGEVQSIPQWDIHLFGRYQRRHIGGSLGQLTLEDRPRLIFNAAFPALRGQRQTDPALAQPRGPTLGNIASLGLSQPGLFEARTHAFARTVWEYGPDPFLGFVRSDVFLRLGAARGFWARRLVATLALQQDLFAVLDEPAVEAPDVGPAEPGEIGSSLPSSYRYAYLEQDLRLDLRDSRTRARSGAYFAINATQAPRWVGSDWSAVRVVPEVRTYLPLPLDIVFAQRLAIASLFIIDASADLDPTSRELGPTNYRLRGGGASSNRGFLAGRLGAGLDGGARRWEASLELRIPIGQELVLAGFADFGDVNRAKAFRFGHLNTSLGYGLRYHTVIGAIRLDIAHRVLAWQRSDGSDGLEADAGTLLFTDAPGAAHLTIGDPF